MEWFDSKDFSGPSEMYQMIYSAHYISFILLWDCFFVGSEVNAISTLI